MRPPQKIGKLQNFGLRNWKIFQFALVRPISFWVVLKNELINTGFSLFGEYHGLISGNVQEVFKQLGLVSETKVTSRCFTKLS